MTRTIATLSARTGCHRHSVRCRRARSQLADQSVALIGVLSPSIALDGHTCSVPPHQNQAVLDELPDLAGRSFKAYHEVGPPPGGEGLMASVIYAAPHSMTPPEIVDFFEQAMPDWEPICRQDKRKTSATNLRRGTAWLVVSAGGYDFEGVATPGFTIAVNALDGEIMQRDFVSRQRCD